MKEEIEYLKSAIQEAENILKTIGDNRILEKLSFEHHIDKLREQLEELEHEKKR